MLRYERILDLAEIHCDLGTDSRGRKSFEFDSYGVVAFARVVERAAYKAAIKACEDEQVGAESSGSHLDVIYNNAVKDCADAIRSLMAKEQPK